MFEQLPDLASQGDAQVFGVVELLPVALARERQNQVFQLADRCLRVGHRSARKNEQFGVSRRPVLKIRVVSGVSKVDNRSKTSNIQAEGGDAMRRSCEVVTALTLA